MLYPIRANEAERLRHLRELCIVGTEPSSILTQICTFAQELLAVPMVAVTLLDEDHQWLHSRVGLDVDRMPRESAFCNYTILGDDVMVVADASTDPRFSSNPLVTGDLGLRFYAGVPLAMEAGIPVATLCCLDTKPRRFSVRHKKVLSGLGAIALSQIKLHRANIALDIASKTDELTGLPNRRGLLVNLEEAMLAARTSGKKVALLFIDLDRFKEINDTRGHDAGDALLKQVADRISTHLPVSATAARTGGDEFAAVLPSLTTTDEAKSVADDLIQALRTPVRLTSGDANCHASIGVGIYPDDASEAGLLMKAADIALYDAKEAGRGRLALFHPRMLDRLQWRTSKLARAHKALAEQTIIPFYQPKISLLTGKVVGFEALLRLSTPEGIRPPSDIDDAFSDPSLMKEIGAVMLNQVVKDMAAWTGNDIPFGSVAINVTEWDLSSDLPVKLLSRLSEARLPPNTLQIELTESVFLGRNTGSIKILLQELRSAGIQTALDDFGTGFASLTHLRDFPVDWLKLDRSFIGKIDTEQEAAAIVHGVITLAQSLGIGVVAEGVETNAQLEFLERRRCDLAQGYLFSRAIAASRVPQFLTSWTGVTPNSQAQE